MTTRTFLADLVGSFSTPAATNPTVDMVEAAFRDAGLNARYINCEVEPDALADAVRGAVAMQWLGFNCSIPHKVAVIEHLDGLAASAEIIGAVNCVVIKDGRLTGENTDGQGFVSSLLEVADPTGQEVVIMGAGGAGRAIAVETALAGAARITIVNRDAGRGQALADLISERTPATGTYLPWTPGIALPPAGIVINATSVGFAPQTEAIPDVDLDSLMPGSVVADVVVSPPNTRWLQEARARGCTTLDGMGMLVNQALIGIRLWTGRELSGAAMRAELEQIFGA